MITPKYMYDIFDIIDNDYVIKNALSAEVVEIIGIPREYVSVFCREHTIFQSRYRIDKKPVIKSAKPVKAPIPDREVCIPMSDEWING